MVGSAPESRRRTTVRHALAAVAMAGMLAVSGCEAQGGPSPDGGEFLAGRVEVGGLCAVGECRTELKVLANGTWDLSRNGEHTQGRLASVDVDTVRAGVAATRLAGAAAFSGTCPSASDGTEVIYSWRNGSARQEISSCKRIVDPSDPLVSALDSLASRLQ